MAARPSNNPPLNWAAAAVIQCHSAMPQHAIIRDATPDDAVALARIHIIARATAMPWLAKVHRDAETEAWMAAAVIGRQRVRVATVDGVPAGFAAVAPGWLEQLYVDPAHQN